MVPGVRIPPSPPSERSSTNYPAQPELGMKNAVRRSEAEMAQQSRLLRHLTESNELILNRTNEPSTYRCRTWLGAHPITLRKTREK